MTAFQYILATAAFLVVLIFGTHYIRTWAFNRYEAVTFECAAAAVLLSLLLIERYGPLWRFILLFVILLLMFAGISYAQWHFYMVLQKRIKEAFSERTTKHSHDQDAIHTINHTLRTMASVAIMPSFSRFIEESKFFNNPGNLIGLIKSIMKRQRFQKKKYQMRECFADNVNLIGPCKPAIDDMMRDRDHFVPGAIHANDLALKTKDEKRGLLAFDVLGFGALIIIGAVLIYLCLHPLAIGASAGTGFGRALFLLVASVLFTFCTHILRHYAFARYESISYEFSFTALVIAAFRVFDTWIAGGTVTAVMLVILGAALVCFLVLSFSNRHADKKLHKQVNEKYEKILYEIPLEPEANRIKRRFLQNLTIISEWMLVPFPGGKDLKESIKGFIEEVCKHLHLPVKEKSPEEEKQPKIEELSEDEQQSEEEKKPKTLREKLECFIKNNREDLAQFKVINRKKQEMPALTEELIHKLIPELEKAKQEEQKQEQEKEKQEIITVSAADFKLDAETQKRTKTIGYTVCAVEMILVFICIACGLL